LGVEKMGRFFLVADVDKKAKEGERSYIWIR
jgi:hypothetical protein